MTRGLFRLHHSGQSHFITVSCYRCEKRFASAASRDLFLLCLEAMRRKFVVFVYGYVVMPEHVHLLMSEPRGKVWDDATRWMRVAFSKRWKSLQKQSAMGGTLVLTPPRGGVEAEAEARSGR